MFFKNQLEFVMIKKKIYLTENRIMLRKGSTLYSVLLKKKKKKLQPPLHLHPLEVKQEELILFQT